MIDTVPKDQTIAQYIGPELHLRVGSTPLAPGELYLLPKKTVQVYPKHLRSVRNTKDHRAAAIVIPEFVVWVDPRQRATLTGKLPPRGER